MTTATGHRTRRRPSPSHPCGRCRRPAGSAARNSRRHRCAICEECLGPLEPVYDPDRPLPDAATIASRPPSLWRYREWLPFEGEPVALARQRLHPAARSARARPPARRGARSGSRTTRVSHPTLVIQGPRRRRRAQRGARPRARHGGLRLDRQPGQRRRGPGRARRARGLDLHPRRPRAGQGGRHRGVRPAAGAGPRHLRRREPPLLPGGRPLRLGPRQHQPARLLRRGLEDRRLRDRRAARLAHCRPRWSRRWRAARWSPSWGRASPSSPGRGWCRGRRHDSTAPRRRAARRSCGWWSAAASTSSRSSRTPSRARSRSAIPPTAASPRRRSAGAVAGRPG